MAKHGHDMTENPNPQLHIDQPAKRTCILVLGMHRSGTSAVTRVVNLMGAALPKNILGAGHGNETGHWEPERLIAYHDQLLGELGSAWHDWSPLDFSKLTPERRQHIKHGIAAIIQDEYLDADLIVIKDPRISRFASFFIETLADNQIESTAIIVLRNPLDVINSLITRDYDWPQHYDHLDAALLWLAHMLESERAARTLPHAILSYDVLLGNPVEAIKTALKSAGLATRLSASNKTSGDNTSGDKTPEIAAFIDGKYRHHAQNPQDLGLDPVTAGWVAEAYGALKDLEHQTHVEAARSILDRVYSEFQAAMPVLKASESQRKAAFAATRLAKEEAERLRGDVEAGRAAHENASKAQAVALKAEAIMQRKVEKTNKQLAATKQQFEAALASAQEETERLRGDVEAAQAARDEGIREIETLRSEISQTTETLIAEIAAARQREIALLTSTSWKLTAPVRMVGIIKINLIKFYSTIKVNILWIRQVIYFGGGILPVVSKVRRVFNDQGIGGVYQRIRIIRAMRMESDQYRVPNVNAYLMMNKPNKSLQQPYVYASEFSNYPPLAITSKSTTKHQRPSTAANISSEDAVCVERTLSQAVVIDADSAIEALCKIPLNSEDATWEPTAQTKEMTLKELLVCFDRFAPNCKNIVLAFSHDDFQAVTGGVQLCLQVEQRQFVDQNIGYINIYPHQPLATLSNKNDPSQIIYQVTINGNKIGSVSGDNLISAIITYRKVESEINCIVHALHGHAPELIIELSKKRPFKRAIFWIHDYFTACSNHLLLRNGITFCNAPPVDSAVCRICSYGEKRKNHIERIFELFQELNFEVISPSEHALSLWKTATNLPYKSETILPHVTLSPSDRLTNKKKRSTETTVNIAFLGYPSLHKGWATFKSIATNLASDTRFRFHHLGLENTYSRNIKFTSVRTSALDPDAMTRLIIEQGIDIAFIWSIWPETFCFTMYEAIAGGASIITNSKSGNVQAKLKDCSTGWLLEDVNDLLPLLTCDQFLEGIRARKDSEYQTYEAEKSRMSSQFIK
jgi:hypothetical protein